MATSKPLELRKTGEFRDWYAGLEDIDQALVDARLDEIINHGRFIKCRNLGRGLLELKWKIGLRVYCSRKKIGNVDVLVLWGGFKGTQKQDIKKARNIKKRYANV